MPDPQDAIVGKSRRFRQTADVFNMLVSVYGSKELFVKEYRQILAERLIKAWNRDVRLDAEFEQFFFKVFLIRDITAFQRILRTFFLLCCFKFISDIVLAFFDCNFWF